MNLKIAYELTVHTALLRERSASPPVACTKSACQQVVLQREAARDATSHHD